MNSVFLCHSSLDKPFIKKLAKQLEFHGLKVWLDENEIAVGDSLSTMIQNGLENCDYVLVALSKSSLESPWVQKELAAAYSLEIERGGNFILPAVVEKAKIPLFLRDKKYADFSKDFDSGLSSILTAFFGNDILPEHKLKNLKCSVLIDIIRLDGSIAKYEKKHTLQCIKGSVDSYVETHDATGRVTNLKTTNGQIVSELLEGGFNNITIKLSKTLVAGDIFKRKFTCDYLDTFIDPENYWEEKEYFVTDELSISIRFPKGRPPISWKSYSKKGANIIDDLTHQVRLTTLKSNPALVFKPETSKNVTSFAIRWEW